MIQVYGSADSLHDFSRTFSGVIECASISRTQILVIARPFS
jgi:hypothetical protein